MKLFQLGPDGEVYGEHAGWWLVVSDDLENELSKPFLTQAEAKEEMKRLIERSN